MSTLSYYDLLWIIPGCSAIAFLALGMIYNPTPTPPTLVDATVVYSYKDGGCSRSTLQLSTGERIVVSGWLGDAGDKIKISNYRKDLNWW